MCSATSHASVPSYTIHDLPPGLVSRAKARAKSDDTTLDAVLATFLAFYAENGPQGRAGGQARAESLSPEERSAIAKKAAEARWKSE